MENLETIEVNVDDLIDENATSNDDMIEASPIEVSNSDVDVMVNSKMAASMDNYAEVKTDDDISVNEQPSSSILPLCITVFICLAVGITLGIIVARKTANK